MHICLLQRVKHLLQPAPEWGPAVDVYREQYIATLKGEQRQRVLPSTLSQTPLFKYHITADKTVDSAPHPQEALISNSAAATSVV